MYLRRHEQGELPSAHGKPLDGAAPVIPGLQPVERLTRRELEVLALISEGLSNEEISRLMAISLDTVKYHLKNIYGKLGVKRRTQAVAVALRFDLIGPRHPPEPLRPCIAKDAETLSLVGAN